jgi:photosynthetic reaction center cytochrome c subunit
MNFRLGMALAIIAVIAIGLMFTFERPPAESLQNGYRGTGMVQIRHPDAVDALAAANVLPEITPALPAAGQTAGQQYMNVQVLRDVDANEFIRLMTDLTKWVAPTQGCAYCHAQGEDLSADTLYTKVVARRMLEMTRHINANWKDHVSTTGVTCYTCHRGNPVPQNVWFTDPSPPSAENAGNRAGQNTPARAVGLTSLPYDPFTTFLGSDEEAIRVVSTTALPAGSNRTIKQTEWTYGLMIHMSEALGVNCTFCHNSRSFTDWDQSSPQRATSFYGIRLVRDVNKTYISPLAAQLPGVRLGPYGDAPKVSCATCHQGANKPLLGQSLLKDYPELSATPSR